MTQNSKDWLEWRRQGLGASDAPIVLGLSPYKTPFQLAQDKWGNSVPDEGNWATKRGTEMEPRARAWYETMVNIDMPPTLAQHERYPFLRASLDGYNAALGLILEIKCPGAEDHATAKAGSVPEKYVPQLDHQLLVTGAKRVDYVSFDGTTGVIVQHFPDVARTKILFKALLDFWKLIETGEEPALCDKDYKTVKDPDLRLLIKEWKMIKVQADKINGKEERLRKEITAMCELDHVRLRYSDVKIAKIKRKGNIDYSKVPELKGVELDQYRKPDSASWRFDFRYE